MLKIKLTINNSGVYANGMFIDGAGNKCSINKTFFTEEKALGEIEMMRDRDCEFSLVIIRSM